MLLLTTVAYTQPFITTWNTTNAGVSGNNQITIPTDDVVNQYNIHWEEVGNAANNGDLFNQVGTVTITFPFAGNYRVEISGNFTHLYLYNNGNPSDAQKLMSIEQWGSIAWSSMRGAFTGSFFLSMPATDVPDLSNVTDMSMMFMNCNLFNADIGDWDVSNVANMTDLFNSPGGTFNQDLSAWNVSNVTTMSGMFKGLFDYNQDLNTWDVSNVTDFSSMFMSTFAFNGDVTNWNVSKATTMELMFFSAAGFNQDISGWDVSNVTNMGGMFLLAGAFNQNIGNWDVSKVTNMNSMFLADVVFNQDISNWNVGAVTNMSFMFYNASAFNQDIGNWNVSNVTDMSTMFRGAIAFNQNIGAWDVGKVTNMKQMFDGATIFDQDLSNWNFANVADMTDMLDTTSLSQTNYDAFLNALAKKNLNTNVTLGALGLQYCDADTARATLIARGWSVTGDTDGCVTLQPQLNVLSNGQLLADKASVDFHNTGVGLTSNLVLTLRNVGAGPLVITGVAVTGDDFSLVGSPALLINPGDSTGFEIRFAPTELGQRTGAMQIFSNDDIPVYTINFSGDGDADIEVYNVVTVNKNGKHDFLVIRNIELFPENKVTIFDRWGNLVFEKNGYDNLDIVFAGTGDDNKLLSEGTYYYVIDKKNGSANKTGFLFLRR